MISTLISKGRSYSLVTSLLASIHLVVLSRPITEEFVKISSERRIRRYVGRKYGHSKRFWRTSRSPSRMEMMDNLAALPLSGLSELSAHHSNLRSSCDGAFSPNHGFQNLDDSLAHIENFNFHWFVVLAVVGDYVLSLFAKSGLSSANVMVSMSVSLS